MYQIADDKEVLEEEAAGIDDQDQEQEQMQ